MAQHCKKPSFQDFASLHVISSLFDIDEEIRLVSAVGTQEEAVRNFDPIMKNRLATYHHQILIFILMRLKPFIVLKESHIYEEIMYEYGVRRMIDMDDRYVRMVSGAKPNERIRIEQITFYSKTLIGALHELVEMLLAGTLAGHAKLEMVRPVKLLYSYGNLHKYLDDFFEIKDNTNSMIEFIHQLDHLIVYLRAEIIEISLKDNSHISTIENMVKAIDSDPEISLTFHYRCIGYFSSLYNNICDFSDFAVDGLMPPVNIQNMWNISQNEYESDTKKRKLDPEYELMRKIPIELHEEVVKHFDTLECLLNMRLVCKFWNYLIVTNPLVWKHLSYHTLNNQLLFSPFSSIVDFSMLQKDNSFQSPFKHTISGVEISWFEYFKIRFHHFLKLSETISKISFPGDRDETAEQAKLILKNNILFSCNLKKFYRSAYIIEKDPEYDLLCFIDFSTLQGFITSLLFPNDGGIGFFLRKDKNDHQVRYYETPKKRFSSRKFKVLPVETCRLSFDFLNPLNPILECMHDRVINYLDSEEGSVHICNPIPKSLSATCSVENDIILLSLVESGLLLNFVISKDALRKQDFKKCRLFKTKHLTKNILEEQKDPDFFSRY